jgi:hypothetical protein
LAAGLCAGFATQFKFVYVAAMIAGTVWLLWRKRTTDAAMFTTAAMISSVGLYLVLWWREPRMLSQILALSPGIRDFSGCLSLLFQAIRTPLILLALPALPAVISRLWPRWVLVLFFAAVSLGIGALADIQAGGSVNYFFEALFGLVPCATLGTLRLLAWSRRNAALAVFLTGFFLLGLLAPELQRILRHAPISPRTVRVANQDMRNFGAALRGRRIFSTLPRLALFDPEPALTEPFLLSYLRRLGKYDGKPILDRVRRGEFDVAITADEDASWRGVHIIDDGVREAITVAYRPYCVAPQKIVYLPRGRPQDSSLSEALVRAGCAPLPLPVSVP